MSSLAAGAAPGLHGPGVGERHRGDERSAVSGRRNGPPLELRTGKRSGRGAKHGENNENVGELHFESSDWAGKSGMLKEIMKWFG